MLQYGRTGSHDTEEAKSRFIARYFPRLFVFSEVQWSTNQRDYWILNLQKKEHYFYAVSSVSIVFIEVKKALATGKGRLRLELRMYPTDSQGHRHTIIARS